MMLTALVCCKTDKQPVTNINTEIEKTPSEMWTDFISANPEFKNTEIPESDFFHNNKEDADRLADLTLKGIKKASSGLYMLYQQYEVDLPGIGEKQIVTDFDGNAKAIIENVKVDTVPFNKISKEYAKMDMGTDIEPLKKWKKAHWDFFESFLKENGQEPNEEMLLVCVRFKKIWPE